MAYGYQDGNLTTVTKPSGATTTFVYDDRRRVTAWIDSNNSRYDYTYDDRDRVIAEGGEAGPSRSPSPTPNPTPRPVTAPPPSPPPTAASPATSSTAAAG
ncbi:hypothetical protein QEP66_26015 [Streptomyces sp. LB8]|nr:hypothetical protein [Streptomyces sp. LB8]MDN5385481.1 hypothetical protein [Streptomyces sp. LB8]